VSNIVFMNGSYSEPAETDMDVNVQEAWDDSIIAYTAAYNLLNKTSTLGSLNKISTLGSLNCTQTLTDIDTTVKVVKI